MSETRPLGVLGFVRVLLAYILPYRGLCAVLVLALLLDVGFDTALRLSFKFLLDDVIAPHDHRLLVWILGALGAGAVVASCAMVGRDYIYARLSASVLNDIRLDMFSHLQRLGIGFYTETRTGEVIARFSTDLAAIEGAISYGLGGGAMAIMGIAFALVPLFLLEWRLALVALVGLPIALIGARLLTPRATAASYEVKEGQARLVSVVEENVGAQPVVKAFGLEVLPVLEVGYDRLDASLPRILPYESKWHPESPYWNDVGHREARLDSDQVERLRRDARLLFERLGCRDYARFDFRASRDGTIRFLEANPNPAWCWDGKLALMGKLAGLEYPRLLWRILDAVERRLAASSG